MSNFEYKNGRGAIGSNHLSSHEPDITPIEQTDADSIGNATTTNMINQVKTNSPNDAEFIHGLSHSCQMFGEKCEALENRINSNEKPLTEYNSIANITILTKDTINYTDWCDKSFCNVEQVRRHYSKFFNVI